MNEENRTVATALAILATRLREGTTSLTTVRLAEEYLLHRLMLEEREIFGALWLDAKNRLLACEYIALGTINQLQIYPREVVKSALKHNAASGIIFHNHPGGDAAPSDSDKLMTMEMKQILNVVDVRLIDHIVVAGTQTQSFAKNGDIGRVHEHCPHLEKA